MSTYTKIKTLPLSLFNNAEYLSFMNHVLDLANGNSGDGDSESPDEISLLTDSDGIPELGLTKEFLDTYEADLLAMADVVDESRTSPNWRKRITPTTACRSNASKTGPPPKRKAAPTCASGSTCIMTISPCWPSPMA